MPRWEDEEESWDHDLDPAQDDIAENDESSETIPCPHCHRQIYEDAQRCPHCGQYISNEDAPPSRKPWWIILGVIVCLYLVIRWVLR